MIYTHLITYIVNETIESGLFTTSNFGDYLDKLKDLFGFELMIDEKGNVFTIGKFLGVAKHEPQAMKYVFDELASMIDKEGKTQIFTIEGNINIMTNSFDNQESFFS